MIWLALCKFYVVGVCRPYRRRPQLLTKLTAKDDVMGVAQLDDKIYVVCYSSSTVEVFAAGSPYNKLKDIEVKDLKYPWDLAVYTETKQLYIADYREVTGVTECVWRVSLDIQIPIASIAVSANTLSVTSQRLLVTSDESNKLFLFGADGKELKQVQLPDYMNPWHAVENESHGTFVVCHTGRQQVVSEVDGDGRVLRVYGDQRGSGPQQLNEPRHVTLDASLLPTMAITAFCC